MNTLHCGRKGHTLNANRQRIVERLFQQHLANHLWHHESQVLQACITSKQHAFVSHTVKVGWVLGSEKPFIRLNIHLIHLLDDVSNEYVMESVKFSPSSPHFSSTRITFPHTHKHISISQSVPLITHRTFSPCALFSAAIRSRSLERAQHC